MVKFRNMVKEHNNDERLYGMIMTDHMAKFYNMVGSCQMDSDM